MEEVPCVCVDELTPEQVKALRIVDNKTNESPWDLDILRDELLDIDLDDFDFEFDKIDLPKEAEIERKEAEFYESISILVECSSDEEAEELFNNLKAEGYKCRISTL